MGLVNFWLRFEKASLHRSLTNVLKDKTVPFADLFMASTGLLTDPEPTGVPHISQNFALSVS